jgi:predicted GNAT family acetyltransferase
VDVLRSSSVAAYLDVAGEFLREREAENNLIFGILSNISADPTQYTGSPYLATVLHGDRVVGTAMRTPPWRLIVSDMDHPAAAHQLAQDLAGEQLPGVVGPADAAGHFAEAWAEVAGASPRLHRHERNFKLTKVIPPQRAPGHWAIAEREHHELLIDWVRAFHDEANLTNPPQDYVAMTDRWIRRIGRMAYLWIDEGRPVSLAGVGGRTPNGGRIGPVYTPPELRGRGYASNVVAAASQELLDEGRRFAFLMTDLANPTANRIYQAIGYEPVGDVDEWEFD